MNSGDLAQQSEPSGPSTEELAQEDSEEPGNSTAPSAPSSADEDEFAQEDSGSSGPSSIEDLAQQDESEGSGSSGPLPAGSLAQAKESTWLSIEDLAQVKDSLDLTVRSENPSDLDDSGDF